MRKAIDFSSYRGPVASTLVRSKKFEQTPALAPGEAGVPYVPPKKVVTLEEIKLRCGDVFESRPDEDHYGSIVTLKLIGLPTQSFSGSLELPTMKSRSFSVTKTGRAEGGDTEITQLYHPNGSEELRYKLERSHLGYDCGQTWSWTHVIKVKVSGKMAGHCVYEYSDVDRDADSHHNTKEAYPLTLSMRKDGTIRVTSKALSQDFRLKPMIDIGRYNPRARKNIDAQQPPKKGAGRHAHSKS